MGYHIQGNNNFDGTDAHATHRLPVSESRARHARLPSRVRASVGSSRSWRPASGPGAGLDRALSGLGEGARAGARRPEPLRPALPEAATGRGRWQVREAYSDGDTALVWYECGTCKGRGYITDEENDPDDVFSIGEMLDPDE